MANTDPVEQDTSRSGPDTNFEVVRNGDPEGSFFNPTPVEEIDFSPIQRKGMQSEPIDAKKTLRFIVETANGPIEEEQFEDIYSKLIGAILDPEINDKLMRAYDILEAQEESRILAIMNEIEKRGALAGDEFVTINKWVLLFTVATD